MQIAMPAPAAVNSLPMPCGPALKSTSALPHLAVFQMDLNNRLRADEGIRTAAVFLSDDDVLLR